MIKIAVGDPGKQRDYFGFVGIEIDTRKKLIFVKFAKRWQREDYLDVEREIAAYHEEIKWNYIYIEQNNTGEHVIEVLKRQYHLPIRSITTSKNLKDPKKIHSVKVMDKNEIVSWYVKAKQNHIIKFPRNTQNQDMKELITQVSTFSEYITEAGNVSYHAPGTTHDDLMMALLIACFVARKYIRTDSNFEHVGGGIPKANYSLRRQQKVDDLSLSTFGEFVW